MATLREISQTGKEANWKKDKTIKLTSLQDYEFLQFDDLDFFNKAKTILASFENFTTTDVVQEGLIKSITQNTGADGQTDGRWRVDYYPYGTDLSDDANPIVGDDIISSDDLSLSVWIEGNYDSSPPGYNENLSKVLHPIKEIGFDILQTIQFRHEITTVDASTTVTHLANSNIVAGLYISGFGLPDGAKIDSITDETTFELDVSATESSTTLGTISNGIQYLQHYIVLQNLLDNPEKGIDWNESYSEDDWSAWQWEVVQEAYFENDVVINDSRFTTVDKQFRGE